jgi:EpsI family protein
MVTVLLTHLRSPGEAVPIRKGLDTFPERLGDWKGHEATIFEVDVLNVLKVKDYLMRRYADADGRSLWLYIAYWDTQRKGAQIHSPKNCLPGAGWEPLDASRVTVAVPRSDASITVNRYLLQKESDQQLVFYWYQSQGRAIADEVTARVDLLRRAALYHRSDGALVRVSSPVRGHIRETSDRLVDYIRTIQPILGEYLPG